MLSYQMQFPQTAATVKRCGEPEKKKKIIFPFLALSACDCILRN